MVLYIFQYPTGLGFGQITEAYFTQWIKEIEWANEFSYREDRFSYTYTNNFMISVGGIISC